MKKEFLTHLFSTLFFFALITLYRRWFDSPWYLMFWLGGLAGTFLPDLDHLIYTLLTRPKEVTSQRVNQYLSQRQFLPAADLLARTRYERVKTIFHNAPFQVFFLVFAFLVITSSASLFGRGLVLAFILHLLVDQAKDLQTRGSFAHWFEGLNLNLDQTKIAFYWVINFLLLLIFGLFF